MTDMLQSQNSPSDGGIATTPPLSDSGITWDSQPTPSPAQTAPNQSGITWDTQPAPSSKTADPTTMNAGDDFATKAAKAGVGILKGIGEGMFSTAAGGYDIATKAKDLQDRVLDSLGVPSGKNLSSLITPDKGEALRKTISNWLHNEAGENEASSASTQIGYGGETLMEFLLGDEALKSLPLAKKLETAAKAMKTIEGSPRMAQALQIGARVLAKTALHGTEAGITQGAQTLVRSGGDVGEAAKQGGEMGATSAVLGAGTGVLGEAAQAAGKLPVVADNLNKLSDAAKNAISEQGVFAPLGRAIAASKSAIDAIFNTASDKADTAKTSAAADKESAIIDTNQEHAQNKQNLQEHVATQEGVAEATKESTIKTTNDALEKARQVVKNKLLDNLEKVSADAPSPEEVAPALSDAIVKYNKSAQEAYEKGINGEQGIATQLKGQTIPYAGSKSSAAALEGLNTPNPEDDPVTKLAKDVSGDKIDAKTKALLQTVADGKEADVTEGTGKNAKVTPGKPLPDRDIDTLVKQRQAVRAAAFGYTSGDINQRVLLKLRDAIDDDIETLANNSNKPEVVQQYQDLKSNYRQQRQLLDSNAAEKLNLKSPDQALDDATKYLTSGTNSAAKVAAITKIAGPETMADLAKVRIQQFKTAAELNPTKFVADWSKVSAPMRNNFFGPDLAQKIDEAVETYKQTSQYAEDQAAKALESAETARQAAGVSNKTNSALFGKALDADKDAQLKAVSDKYDSTVQSIQDKLDQAKATHTEALSPHSTSFVRNLADGRVSDQLLKGTVDLQDVKNVKQVVGDKWPDIANGLFQRGIADNEGNPEKILDWWNKIKPDVRSEIFANTPESEAAYNKAIDSIKDTAAVKQLVKNAVLKPIGFAAGATPGILLGSAAGAALHNPVATPFIELIGAMASAGGGRGTINKIVDYVADHPSTWKVLGKVGSLASKAAPVLQSDILPNVAAKGAVSGVNDLAKRREQQKQILAGAQSTLSQ